MERKNLKALLRAFHAEFDPSEPVNLFIKTSGVKMQDLQQYANQIKAGLKIRGQYIEEIFVSGMMDEKDYYGVLSQCSCLVVPSRAEGPRLGGYGFKYSRHISRRHRVDTSRKRTNEVCSVKSRALLWCVGHRVVFTDSGSNLE